MSSAPPQTAMRAPQEEEEQGGGGGGGGGDQYATRVTACLPRLHCALASKSRKNKDEEEETYRSLLVQPNFTYGSLCSPQEVGGGGGDQQVDTDTWHLSSRVPVRRRGFRGSFVAPSSAISARRAGPIRGDGIPRHHRELMVREEGEGREIGSDNDEAGGYEVLRAIRSRIIGASRVASYGTVELSGAQSVLG
ncbi:hypothetical protein CBR_g16807 [Chara braunii]|uniref:Uncharacterized protein n=1 Tax=Chara braunii TaxID=69332 RepID=A0A388KTT7_CHABU|nr:hypothetical protein CBR_g16807 [Chara braunii]|eukprot:GBG73466.1 hypothetical protein CBR_g16807 [Chara braunii]